MRRLILTVACLLASSGVSVAQPEQSGSEKGALIIAGGALADGTASVWETFLSLRSGLGPIVIIPSSSGAPASSAASAAETLTGYLDDPGAIVIAPLAAIDDPSTAETDESAWADNASDPDVAALIRSASAIWFTGGDQLRTTQILLDPDGHATPVLEAIEAALADGVPIGGSSAGAAIMSDTMLLQGDSMAALTGNDALEPMRLGAGLGFFDFGLVDQHFGQRARLGRLAVALMELPNDRPRRGFGIDEDTALVVLPCGYAKVLGSGYVTILDASTAIAGRRTDGSFEAAGLTIGLAAHGDRINLTTLEIEPAAGRKPTIGKEYFDRPAPSGGGLALPGNTLSAVLGEGLVDNSASVQLRTISFLVTGEASQFDFRQTHATRGYWGRTEDGGARYTISGVTFDIIPLRVSLEADE